MEVLKVVALCLSSFSLGVSISGVVFSTLEYRRANDRLKRMDARRADLSKKKEELDTHVPLTQFPWETPEEFANRVQERLVQGKLTMNAARLSIGLPALPKRDKDQTHVRNCFNCKHHSKGSKDNPCALCEDVNGIPDQWEAEE
jgi:hypothetical protein